MTQNQADILVNCSVIFRAEDCRLLAVAYRGEGKFWGVQPPHPHEIPKTLQNRAKLNPIVKTVKNCLI